MEKKNLEKIEKINQHIKDALEEWGSLAIVSEADEWAYYLNYSKEDVFFATQIFMHVISNYGIKNKKLTEENAELFGEQLRDYVKWFLEIDLHELTAEAVRDLHEKFLGKR